MLRAQPGRLECLAANRGSSAYAYVTDHPPEVVAAEGYWLPVADRLRRGDTIRVTIDRDAMFAVADLVVVEAVRTRVRVASVEAMSRETFGGLVVRRLVAEPPPAVVPEPHRPAAPELPRPAARR